MEAITKDRARSIMEDARHALEEVARKHEVEVGALRARFSTSALTLRCELARVNEDGDAETKHWTEYKRRAIIDPQLDPAALGTIRTWGGVTYRITGYRPRSTRYPIQAERTRDGKTFRLPKRIAAPLEGEEV